MSEMGDMFREMRESNKRHRSEQLARVSPKLDSSEWTKHTDWHYSKYIGPDKLDFWPSTDKFMFRGKVYKGGLNKMKKVLKELGV